jgi:predicted transcriptional regulator
MATTIQISAELKDKLAQMKMFDSESYEDLIWDLLEDRMELSEEAEQSLKRAEADFRAGRVYRHEQVKKMLKL